MNLPSKQEVLERERRWLRPAGFVGIAGLLVYAAGQVVQQVGLDPADTTAEQLTEVHEHATQFVAGQALQGLGVALFAIPLYVLFKAAEARAERVRGALVGFCLIGPVLFGVGTTVSSFGIKDAADTFVEDAPAVEQEARQKAEAEEGDAAKPAPDAKRGKKPEATTTTETTAEEAKSPDEAAQDAREDLADEVDDDSSLIQTGRYLLVPGVLAFLFALAYSSLWSLRTGLLTRFWGSLGMALGVGLILLGGFGLLLTVIWFAVLSLRFAGLSRRGLPPAWEAGVAIPWEPPGQGAPPEDDRDVEGSGRELSEPRLPEESEVPDEGEQNETQGPPRKKRKRRG